MTDKVDFQTIETPYLSTSLEAQVARQKAWFESIWLRLERIEKELTQWRQAQHQANHDAP